MLTLNSFLCCRLHTAGIVFGWLGAISSLFYLIIMSIALSNVDNIAENMTPKGEDPEQAKTGLTVIFAVYLTISAINFVASFMLLIGTLRERHLLLLPWLINRTMSLIVELALLIALSVYVAKQKNKDTPGQSSVPAFIYVIIQIAFDFWIWLVIYSLFRQIRSNLEQQRLIPGRQAENM